ncbi:alpha-1,6-glucosidase domain-containing protein [Glaciecola petra]|uniref:Alpha-1,6-glucosidase domain-containing protein n=1 Tax=Glaciecola petra TaxID=3075602 RepID=A0ABU2ZPD4_9ALTE|nr:alpha-1,6-glucosidase domain-containing protein [Aestuariibacter sp. P117]MDT0594460.1 alpha-1,6-glucosidase domain-containing protein [Aestuariibacter sp. P117]
MVNLRKTLSAILLVMSALILAGCGGSGVEPGQVAVTCNVPNIPNASGTCVPPPPILCPAPTVPNDTNDACVVGFNSNLPDPVFFPAENQAVLYYNRGDVDADNSANDPVYEGWRLHTWSNAACDAYADGDTAWADGRIHDGIDPTYGAYWILDLKPGYADTEGACHNFIIHIGTDDAGKEMGGGDFAGSLTQDDPRFARMNFTLSGIAEIYEFPIDSLGEQPVSVEGAQAHWLDAQTILWNVDDAIVDTVKLHYSADANLDITLEEGVLNSTTAELTEVDLTDAQQMIAPHLNGLTAFAGNWTNDDAKAVLTTQAIVGAYDSENKLVAATRLQIGNVLDELYTSGDADADETALGAIYTDSGITAAVWAPTAQNVALKLYNDDKTLASSNAMTLDPVTGVWSYNGGSELDRQLYRYEVTVYSPVNDTIEVLDVTDPYSVSLSVNGRFSQFVNLNDDDLKPDGWETHNIPTVENFEDIVIYEGHIRNFSIRDESTSEANRGKYMAFTEKGSAPMQHLQTLQSKGLTHFHVLPANDIATINEDSARTVDWNSTIQELCALTPSSDVCNDNTPRDITIAEHYESFSVLTEPGAAQAFTEQLRNFDLFNWGYDPKHFNTPEGSYSSDADSVARIKEMRSMNQSLHEIGLRVALDVVYNHTNASGLFANSVFDKVVPGYYHRYNIETGDIIRETCCDDTEPRNRMMEKFMEDSLLMWSEQYKFDAFRFDIMSQASKTTMVELFESVKAVDPDTYFYGEGWGKNTAPYGDFEIASQFNMAGTEIGTFNDRIREAVRQGEIFSRETSEGALNAQDRVKMSLAGTLTDFILKTSGGSDSETSVLGGYALDPADIINYVSKHDNETLWDQFNYVLPEDLSLEERVRAQNIGIGIPLMSQGIPFLQMGGDFLRSKSMDRNTFDAGDWFNYVDFTMQTNNWNVGLPLAQDNQGRWDEISQFMNSPERAASMSEIEFAAEVFQEFLSIRSASSLFRLTTADEIKNRVGFHNLGARQQQGLIAMSIDDGINGEDSVALDDLDMNYDALMVVINSGYEEKSIEVMTAAGFELHPMLMNSIDPTVRGASFTDTSTDEQVMGMFTVPPLTIAVFVKSQGMERGYGLAATATAGAPDVVPYGDTTVYVRGGFNDWGLASPMEYKGEGVYEAAIEVEGNTEYFFKVASEDWSTVDFGENAEPVVIEGEAKTLKRGEGNLSTTLDVSATYLFTLDASDANAPVLTVVNEEPYVGNTIYIRGSMNGWGTGDELLYQGSRIYSASLNLDAAEHQFKVANEGWAGPNLGGASADPADVNVSVGGQDQFLFEGGDNLVLDISEAGDYVFIFDTQNLDEPKVRVFAEAFFGETPVYIRGGMNGWGEVDQLEYQGAGVYSVNIALDAADVDFKVASSDWSTINLGAVDENSNGVTVDQPYTLFRDANSQNMSISISEAGTYEFKVVGPDANAPTLTVSPIE